MMSDGIHLFSNGFEGDCWQERNCDRCVKQDACDLQDALHQDSIIHDLPCGSVTLETASRLGYTDAYWNVLGWPCAERRADKEPPTPAATEMVKAGAGMLPGFADIAAKPAERRQSWTG
jgi:hypothetical protein